MFTKELGKLNAGAPSLVTARNNITYFGMLVVQTRIVQAVVDGSRNVVNGVLDQLAENYLYIVLGLGGLCVALYLLFVHPSAIKLKNDRLMGAEILGFLPVKLIMEVASIRNKLKKFSY